MANHPPGAKHYQNGDGQAMLGERSCAATALKDSVDEPVVVRLERMLR